MREERQKKGDGRLTWVSNTFAFLPSPSERVYENENGASPSKVKMISACSPVMEKHTPNQSATLSRGDSSRRRKKGVQKGESED